MTQRIDLYYKNSYSFVFKYRKPLLSGNKINDDIKKTFKRGIYKTWGFNKLNGV